MSDFSLTLVLRLKTSKIINGMANISIKSQKITPFGGIFHVMEKFDIDSHLGLRSTLIGYQYSEIIRAIFSFVSFVICAYSLIRHWPVISLG